MSIQRDVDTPQSCGTQAYAWLADCKRELATFSLWEDTSIEFLEEGRPTRRVGLPSGVYYGSAVFVSKLASLLEDSGAYITGVSLILPVHVATDLDLALEEGRQPFMLLPPKGRRYASVYRPWRVVPFWPMPDRIRRKARMGLIPYELAQAARSQVFSIIEGIWAEVV